MTSKFKSRNVYWLILAFLVHVCVDLYRVLAHACAWKVSTGTSKFKSRIVYWLILAFLVHVCADLYKSLAHACAWEVSRVTSKFKSTTFTGLFWLSLYMCVLIYTEY